MAINFYEWSISQPTAFWAEQAQLIEWQQAPQQILDFSHPPFTRWFVGGTTNLCHNAVDRWLPTQAQQPALIYVSTETGQEQTYSFADLYAEVNRWAALLLQHGVEQGDRVLLYMPMIPQAAFAMLACARIGAIHSVVFGGFAAISLASRIDDAQPKLIISADAGSRAGKVVAYAPMLNEALQHAQHQPQAVLWVNRGLAELPLKPGRDVDAQAALALLRHAQVPVVWLESNQPSYILYTSGTTGKPKGVQRDVGGYAVALAASMRYIFDGRAGETFFSTSDIGWVVGHSYIIYGPLLAGMATIMYEGLPINPDPGIWWRLVEKYQVTGMFSAPTAIRVLKKQDEHWLKQAKLSSLRALFLAGEPLDEPTAHWIRDALGVPIVDNYWQTETGWPILTIPRALPNDIPKPTRLGSPGFPVYGFNVQLLDERTGEPVTRNQKGVLAIQPPLPPGCLSTVWGDDARFVKTYFSSVPGKHVYSTFDWGIQDDEGYTFILGRTDDVINVAGHRLGTREIEESLSSHPSVAEVAVIGVQNELKGEVACAFVILRTALPESIAAQALEVELKKVVEKQLGAVARPERIYFVTALPKTRSGKLLRRSLKALCEGRDPGDLTTIEDPTALAQIQRALGQA
ncbi:propionate--CoA ligase [Parvibium lacunae]|uniref:Propionate--CoA ligase n=1 Tax=Parvibium lacunae TaxID=1888893 RepID=A0A368L3C5_9BURK|nr:propionate--CoA ligase [Parvibium lacunae]RCS58091.1 propionate--CoA ligase [Parvibium lacunae]